MSNENPNIPEKFLSPYSPTDTESRIYSMWEESGLFNPDECIAQGYTSPDAEHFSIVLPPPNVTGELHLGHAFEDSTQDAMIRFNRMRGKRTLWVPGTDHAAIATQSKFEKELTKKEKKSRHDFSREEFFDMVQEFALKNQTTILSQLRQMGASLDWSRLCFTLDDTRKNAVYEAFKRMHDTGLIYRGHRSVNWDPKGQTVISDDEIVRKEEVTKFYYFQYGPFEIGTSRPETKFADKYIIVHPEDPRYAQYEHRQEFQVEWINGLITATLIKDEAANMEMGSGVMTITPWHSQVDFDLAEKHNLPKEQIINKYGKLLPIAGEEFAGLKIKDAREKIVEKLQAKGLVTRIEEDYVHQLATAERTGGIIEPQIMEQWFIDVNKKFAYPHATLDGIQKAQEVSLKELMIHVVENSNIQILPSRFEKVYYNWINNLRDWNISRQIIFGHQVPVWYKDGETQVSQESPDEDTNFVFIHGYYRTPDVVDPLEWLSENLPGKNNFLAKLPHSNDGQHTDKEIQYVLDNAQIDENTVIVTHSRGGKLAMRMLQEKNIKIKGLVMIAAGIGDRSIEIDSNDFDTYQFDFEKIVSLVENKIFLFEAETDHVRGPEGFALLAQKLNARHIKAKESASHYNQIKAPEILEEVKKFTWTQDTDTLDTWFSSGLWTFSTLGWPEDQKGDFANYHPTSVINPGYEILFFWIARMILMSTFFVGQIPFDTAYIHGMLRAKDGRKFSKSLNNGINPLEVIEQYGTDALRMALTIGVAPGQDMNFDLQKVNAYKKFANKIWNVTRFILTYTEGIIYDPEYSYSEKDQILRQQQDELIDEITKEMDEYKYYLVGEKLYHYVWDNLANTILEDAKSVAESGNAEDHASRQQFLLHTLVLSLKVLHPFMPFITEEIWQTLPFTDGILMVAPWPKK